MNDREAALREQMPSGRVPPTELFAILVDEHGFAVLDAVRALAIGMATAGYPDDCDSVSAVDALDILERAIRGRGER